jgi:hypothetical protein
VTGSNPPVTRCHRLSHHLADDAPPSAATASCQIRFVAIVTQHDLDWCALNRLYFRFESHPRPGRPGRTSRGWCIGSQPRSPQPLHAALCVQQRVLMVRSDSKENAHGWTTPPQLKENPGSQPARTAGATSVASKLVPQRPITKPKPSSQPPGGTPPVSQKWTAPRCAFLPARIRSTRRTTFGLRETGARSGPVMGSDALTIRYHPWGKLPPPSAGHPRGIPSRFPYG